VLKIPPDMPAVLEIAQAMQDAGEIQPYAPRGENLSASRPWGLAESVRLYGPVVAEIPMADRTRSRHPRRLQIGRPRTKGRRLGGVRPGNLRLRFP